MDYFVNTSNSLDEASFLHNATTSEEESLQWFELSPDRLINIILGVLMIVFNGTVICGILLNKDLRHQPKYNLILIICCLDFFAGAFNHPVLAYLTSIQYGFKPGVFCPIMLFYISQITVLYEITVGILMVCILVINWTLVAHNRGDKKSLLVFITLFSHIVAISIALFCVVPNVMHTSFCMLYYPLGFPVVLVSEAPQLFLLTLVIVILVLSYTRQKSSTVALDFPVDLLVASIITIVCLSPYNIYSIVNFYIPTDYTTLGPMGFLFLLWFKILKCVILPFAWIVDPYFRSELKRGLTCKACCISYPSQDVEMKSIA